MRFIPTNFMSETVAIQDVEYLVVAGGGSGGTSSGGGGGAGGFLSGSIDIEYNKLYNIIVGNSGSISFSPVSGGNGENSRIYNDEIDITSIGGGKGAGRYTGACTDGGSGGGGSGFSNFSGCNGTSGQGTSGGNGFGPGNNDGAGGGGGASTSGQSADGGSGGDGGAGKQWLDGNYYAGGGGGAIYDIDGPTTPGTGGIGGGGNGQGDFPSTVGTPNTGGGGGGSLGASNTRDGGSGIVIIRYQASSQIANGGDNIFASGSYIYHKFTTVGSGSFYVGNV